MEKVEIKLDSLIKNFHYSFLNECIDSFKNVQGIYRPGLELVGYYDYIENNKGIILGKKELNFIFSLEGVRRIECYEFLTATNVPFILIADNETCPKELLEKANEKKVLVLASADDIFYVQDTLTQYMLDKLAPRQKIHGTLLDIYGVGVLLTGDSGIGKSEIALELVKKGHRLVADDSVIVSAFNRRLTGRSPEHLKGFLEVRGLGIINVPQMFGVVSIRSSKRIALIINLVNLNDVRSMNRLINNLEKEKILNIEVPIIKLPVSQGRTMSDLVEVAIVNFRMKQNGYDSNLELAKLYDNLAKGE